MIVKHALCLEQLYGCLFHPLYTNLSVAYCGQVVWEHPCSVQWETNNITPDWINTWHCLSACLSVCLSFQLTHCLLMNLFCQWFSTPVFFIYIKCWCSETLKHFNCTKTEANCMYNKSQLPQFGYDENKSPQCCIRQCTHTLCSQLALDMSPM